MDHCDILQTDNDHGKEEFKHYFLGEHGQPRLLNSQIAELFYQ